MEQIDTTTPLTLLAELKDKYGLGKRSLVESHPKMYGCVEAWDESAEEWSRRWSLLSVTPDMLDSIQHGYSELHAMMVKSYFANPDKPMGLIAVAVVGIGHATYLQDADTEVEGLNDTQRQYLGVNPECIARTIYLCAYTGRAGELTVSVDGELVTDVWSEHLDEDENLVSIGGGMAEGPIADSMTVTFSLAMMLSLCLEQGLEPNPQNLVRVCEDLQSSIGFESPMLDQLTEAARKALDKFGDE